MQNVSRMTIAVILYIVSAFAQTTLESSEMGKFERLSVTYLDAMIPLDNSAKQLTTAQEAYLFEMIQEYIMMPRFDYNPIPQKVEDRVVAELDQMLIQTNGKSGVRMDQVTGLMNRLVVPEIVKYVDAYKELRAQKLMTEQERNSFITDKAKELGITADQLQKVMNSAFIFVPVVSNYGQGLVRDSYTESISVGLVWWRIKVEGDKTGAEIVVQELENSSGVEWVSTGTGYQQRAFESMVENAARSMRTATQEIPAFRLSGQVLSRNGNRVTFDLGTEEGIRVDTRFRIIELTEDPDGGITPENQGWVVVTEVGDSSEVSGYRSEARIVSGRPYIGALLHEYARSNFDIEFGYRRSTIKSDDSLTAARGFDINVNYNLPSSRQFYLGVGSDLLFGSLPAEELIYTSSYPYYSYEESNSSFLFWNVTAQMIKKFQMRRVFTGFELGVGYGGLTFSDALLTNESTFTWSAMGLFEIALSPAINIGAKFGYDGSFGGGIISGQNGIGIGMYMAITPPGLPMNPVDFIKGVAGIIGD